MIEHVAAALRAAGLEPTWVDVVDAIWLAAQIGDDGSPPSPGRRDGGGEPVRAPVAETAARPAEPAPPAPEPVPAVARSEETATLRMPDTPAAPAPRAGLVFRTPAAAALPGALGIARALRPFMRRAPSAHTRVLDEEATAERTADGGIYAPVLRPAPSRWLELAVVVDQSPTMAVWTRTVAELRWLLERQGAFRDVRTWLLDTDGGDRMPALRTGVVSAAGRPRPSHPRELVDLAGRRLILVVSDCVAPAWSTGAVADLLARWGRTGPVALVHLLPQRLWRYTEITTEPVELHAPYRAAPNAKLQVGGLPEPDDRPIGAATDSLPEWPDQVDHPIPVPVVPIDRRWLAPWAALVAGPTGRRTAAVVTWAHALDGASAGQAADDLATDDLAAGEGEPAGLTAADHVRRFRAVVSPTAFKLAGYLAAVPVRLPVMRLVQETMLPGSGHVHLAEVLLGILERRTPAGAEADPDEVEYDFPDGVRALLLETVLGSEALRVLHAVGEFVGRHSARDRTFHSLLSPSDGAGLADPEQRAFAILAAATLRRFGTGYAEYARRLEARAEAGAPAADGDDRVAPPAPVSESPQAGGSPYADLEISLRWDSGERAFDIGLRYENPATGTDDWLSGEEPVRIDLDELGGLRPAEAGYGAALTRMVLGSAGVKQFYARGRAHSDSRLRLRLRLSAPARFHEIRWESLRDPATGTAIATDPGVVFSRYLSDPSWHPVALPAGRHLRALIVIPGPHNPDEWATGGRVLVDVAREVELARTVLTPVRSVRELTGERGTLSAVLDAVGQGVDVLYLACHSALVGGTPVLFLTTPSGEVDARDFVEQLAALDKPPTVVLLSAVQSESTGSGARSADDGALAALGPRLAAAGVAITVAMQGDIGRLTVGQFLATFVAELVRDGIADRAAAAARQQIRHSPEWWVPVLYSRLRDGRAFQVWEPETHRRVWTTLTVTEPVGMLTPIVGPGLDSDIVGSRQDIARQLVEQWQLPITSATQDNLGRVTQYLSTRSDSVSVRRAVLREMSTEISRRRGQAEPGDPVWNIPADPLDDADPAAAIRAIGRRLRASDPDDPYRVLAEMNISVYVTTSWTDMLEDALAERGRQPTVVAFRWNDQSRPEARRQYNPTVHQPIVFHLHGRLDDLSSLVLTEDDYFAWLRAWSDTRRTIPPSIRAALVKNSLLFLGCQLDDWDFRVVYQSIKNLAGGALLRHNLHVAVQSLPVSRTVEAERAREYLESYFGDDNLDIVWADTRDFLAELRARTER